MEDRDTYTSDDDTLVLEDESGRVSLRGDVLDVHGLTTGVVCAVWGKVVEGGDFHVKKITLPGVPPAKPLSEGECVRPRAPARREHTHTHTHTVRSPQRAAARSSSSPASA